MLQSLHTTNAGCHNYVLRSSVVTLSNRRQKRRCVLASAQESMPQGGTSSQPWWASLNRNNIRGPELPSPSNDLLSEEQTMGAGDWETTVDSDRASRQEAWDSMRAVAQQRFERGEMPGWFDPKWLSQEEAPVNAILRNMGAKNYQYDDKWLGTPFPDHVLENEPQAESGGSDGDGGDGRGPWDNRHSRGWWREDDPYWMLRDWGDHPMRWWTLGFAALMAVGGIGAYLAHNSAESLWVGWGCGVWLALCSLAMSDMRAGQHGVMGVKMAWAACAAVAAKDGVYGWSHRAHPASTILHAPPSSEVSQAEPPPWAFLTPRLPRVSLSACGRAAVAMCAALMATGMSGMEEWALPTTPGAVYKSSDVALKQRVWEQWGYGHVSMKQG